jgi:protein SCO1/2
MKNSSSFLRSLKRVAMATLSAAAFALCAQANNALPAAEASAKATALPSDSVYQLGLTLTDQAGRNLALDGHRGGPLLVSMFYTSCQFVCPMLVDALRDTEAKLSADERAKLSVLMVSFDPEHDTVAVLKKTADQRELDPAHWTLARTDAKSVRKLAAVLGIQYRAMKNGDFNHTTALILLDAEGRIAARTTQLGNADPAFVKRVKLVAQGAPH